MKFKTIIDLPDKILRRLERAASWPSQIRVARIKGPQKDKFESIKLKFARLYNELKKHDTDAFSTPLWKNKNKEIEKSFLPYPPFSFLRHPQIKETMFVASGGKLLRQELKLLEQKIPGERLKTLLQEDYVGLPLLSNSTYLTSHNSIHLLYHLIRFTDKTKIDLNDVNTVIEWGGGYGNMAKLFKRLNNKSVTYILIDNPLFTCLQWLYLATIYGEDNVKVLRNSTDTIETGKLNLMPACFIPDRRLKADLFIATWSLSESSKCAQEHVGSSNFFGSKHILIGYQDSNASLPDAETAGKLAIAAGGVVEELEFQRGNYYVFR